MKNNSIMLSAYQCICEDSATENKLTSSLVEVQKRTSIVK